MSRSNIFLINYRSWALRFEPKLVLDYFLARLDPIKPVLNTSQGRASPTVLERTRITLYFLFIYSHSHIARQAQPNAQSPKPYSFSFLILNGFVFISTPVRPHTHTPVRLRLPLQTALHPHRQWHTHTFSGLLSRRRHTHIDVRRFPLTHPHRCCFVFLSMTATCSMLPLPRDGFVSVTEFLNYSCFFCFLCIASPLFCGIFQI